MIATAVPTNDVNNVNNGFETVRPDPAAYAQNAYLPAAPTTAIPPVTVPNWGPAQYQPAQYQPQPQRPAQYQPAQPAQPARGFRRPEFELDQIRYWVGAGLTAVIAALVGLVGLVVAHGILHVPVAIGSGTDLTPLHATMYGLAAAGLAILAAGIYDGMLHVAPRPLAYYGWLTGILTLLAVLLPFTTSATVHAQLALALMNLAVGLTITLLVPLAATNARR
jgi:hypothetical protein